MILSILAKLLHSQCGEVQAGETQPAPNGAADWRPHAEQFKSDPSIGPIIEKWQDKDLPSLIKRHANLEQHLGKAIFPKQNATEEDLKQMRARAVEMKLFPAGAERYQAPPEEYKIARPESIPENLWKEELVGSFTEIAKKHGLSEAAVNDLVSLEASRFENISAALEIDKKQSEETATKWGAEHGVTFKQMMDYAGQWMAKNLTTEEIEMLNLSGMGNHAALISALAKAGMDTGEESSITGGEPAGGTVIADAEKEALDIINNKENPKNKLYWASDPATIKYVEELYAKAHPGNIEI